MLGGRACGVGGVRGVCVVFLTVPSRGYGAYAVTSAVQLNIRCIFVVLPKHGFAALGKSLQNGDSCLYRLQYYLRALEFVG